MNYKFHYTSTVKVKIMIEHYAVNLQKIKNLKSYSNKRKSVIQSLIMKFQI